MAQSADKMVAIFCSAREVIKADEALRSSGFEAKVVPVPTKYSSECGLCIEFYSVQSLRFAEIMASISLEPLIYEH